MTPTERSRACRARRRAGRIVLPIEFDEVAVAELLAATGYFDARHGDDRARLRAALERWLDDAASPAGFSAATALHRAVARAIRMPE